MRREKGMLQGIGFDESTVGYKEVKSGATRYPEGSTYIQGRSTSNESGILVEGS